MAAESRVCPHRLATGARAVTARHGPCEWPRLACPRAPRGRPAARNAAGAGPHDRSAPVAPAPPGRPAGSAALSASLSVAGAGCGATGGRCHSPSAPPAGRLINTKWPAAAAAERGRPVSPPEVTAGWLAAPLVAPAPARGSTGRQSAGACRRSELGAASQGAAPSGVSRAVVSGRPAGSLGGSPAAPSVCRPPGGDGPPPPPPPPPRAGGRSGQAAEARRAVRHFVSPLLVSIGDGAE